MKRSILEILFVRFFLNGQQKLIALTSKLQEKKRKIGKRKTRNFKQKM
jgi:hypothetical protein